MQKKTKKTQKNPDFQFFIKLVKSYYGPILAHKPAKNALSQF